jgi:hypothetical protein
MKSLRWPVVGVVSLSLAAVWAFWRGDFWIGSLLLVCVLAAVMGLVVVVARSRDRPR